MVDAPASAELSGVVEGPLGQEFVGRLSRFSLANGLADGHPPTIASVGPVNVLASPEIDAEAVAVRLERRREELRSEVARAEGKLANEKFVARAPAEVVEEERAKLERYRAELEELTE
jgi:valyl-tRNA synthetase